MIDVDKVFDIDYCDQSGLCEFCRCPAKYCLSRQLGLESPTRMKIALDYGTDIHAALPYCYTGTPEGLDKAFQTFNAAWDRRPYGGEDVKRNKTTARDSLMGFAENHTPANCQYDILHFDIKATTADIISPNEIPFLIDIGGKLPLAGRIDLPARHRATKTIWCDDYKTSSIITENYFKEFHNSPQAVGYTLALSMLTKEDVMGMIVEAIRTSKTKIENQMALIFVSNNQVKSFISWAKRTSEQIIYCNEKKQWPKNPSGCAPYSSFGSHGYYCDFKDICDGVDWREMSRFFVTKEPFHPFKVNRG